jgi:hypothetical protein
MDLIVQRSGNSAQIQFSYRGYLGISNQENYAQDNKDSADSWTATNVYKILSLFKTKEIALPKTYLGHESPIKPNVQT